MNYKKGLHILFILSVFSGMLLVWTQCELILPNKPPFAEILSPEGDIQIKADQTQNIIVNAYDIDGSIATVEFRIDDQLLGSDDTEPYEFTLNGANFAPGEYVLQVIAIDNDETVYVTKVNLIILGVGIISAGEDVTLTSGVNSYVLDAKKPVGSTGVWSTVPEGQGTFSDMTSPNALFTGTLCNSYTLRWTVTNGTEVTSDDVVLTFDHVPTTALAGADIHQSDGSTEVVLDANIPDQGQGKWTIISGDGGVLTDTEDPKTTFTGNACVDYLLRWTISTACNTSSDEVQVRMDNVTIQAEAGPDQIFNNGTTSTQLQGSDPGQFDAVWSIVSGNGGEFADPLDPETVFTGQLCETYVLRYTITSGCGSSSDEVTIVFGNTPTEADAGADLMFADGRTSVFLNANVPTVGEGQWSIISGEGGVMDDPTDKTSRFLGQLCETYVLKWTITAGCGFSEDDVVVVFGHAADVALAGPDQIISNGLLNTQLMANSPESGTGMWSIVSGPDGAFADPGDPETVFTGQLCQTYVLRWTISTACEENFDETTIVFDQVDIPARAGADQQFFDGTISAQLNGNDPESATGTWEIISGSYGSVSDLNDPAAMLNGALGQVYVLKWTISSPCGHNADLVKIAFLSTDSFTDSRDGTVYPTVRINGQEWMTKNMNFKTTENSWPYSDLTDYRSAYGLLYSYEAAQIACPAGWHLPSDYDWRLLEMSLGMSSETSESMGYRGDSEGAELKETGTVHWHTPNSKAVDLVGFTALPGGYRYKDGSYGLLGSMAAFWTATEHMDGEQAIYRALNRDKVQIGRDWFDQKNGISVRCLRDDSTQ